MVNSKTKPPAHGPMRVHQILDDLARVDLDNMGLATRLKKIAQTQTPKLERFGKIPLSFVLPDGTSPEYHIHPQGLARDPKTGHLFISAVEILQKHSPDNTRNGKGNGYLFCFDAAGEPLSTISLSAPDDNAFHPGGMVICDGNIYVPMAPYCTTGPSRILRIPLNTLKPLVLFEVPDHIGAVAINPDTNKLHIVSWDSATWYTYSLSGKLLNTCVNPSSDKLGHQDVQILPGADILMTGVLNNKEGGRYFGLDLVEAGTETIKASMRWNKTDYPTSQNRSPFDNPTFTWMDRAGRIFILAAPDSQTGRYRERPFGVYSSALKVKDDRAWSGSLILYELTEAKSSGPHPDEPHYGEYRALLNDARPVICDTILPQLRSRAGLKLPAAVAETLTKSYEQYVRQPIPGIRTEHASPDFSSRIIGLHRRMLHSERYVESRIADPTTGTLDHLHAEMVADLAVKSAGELGYLGIALEIVRIAGHLHDSDRSFPRLMTPNEQADRGDPTAYRHFKARHMQRCVARTLDLISLAKEAGARISRELTHDITYIVGRHEIGGRNNGQPHTMSRINPDIDLDELADIVRDADSLGFFLANILAYWGECGRDGQKLAQKIRNMFDRASPSTRQHIIGQVIHSKTHALGVNADLKNPDLCAIRGILIRCTVMGKR